MARRYKLSGGFGMRRSRGVGTEGRPEKEPVDPSSPSEEICCPMDGASSSDLVDKTVLGKMSRNSQD